MKDETFQQAAAEIHRDFLPAERIVNEAAASSARLLATVLEHAARPGVSIGAGALMIRKLNGSLTSLIEAREGFAMAHKAAAAVPAELDSILRCTVTCRRVRPTSIPHCGARVYNRFNRWPHRGFWLKLLDAMVDAGAVTKSTAIDST